MAFASTTTSVGTTAAALYTFESDQVRLLVQNTSAGAVFLGGADVTTANGLEVVEDGIVEVFGRSGEVLYGRVASSTSDVRVLAQGA